VAQFLAHLVDLAQHGIVFAPRAERISVASKTS
jgi:hypothetical protein